MNPDLEAELEARRKYYELDEQRKQVEYLFFWFHTRSENAERLCYDYLNPYSDIDRKKRSQITRSIGGRITNMERMIVKLRTEWDKFLTMKKKAKL